MKITNIFKIILVLLIVLLLSVLAFAYNENLYQIFTSDNENKDTACTLDAKLCPDGSYVGRIPPNCEFAACPEALSFDSMTTFTVGKTITYQDGLKITLNTINDSRCKPGVVCVWAGELSTLFTISGGELGQTSKQIQMGTTTAKQIITDGYIFSLGNTTETTAALTVTKQKTAGSPCYVGGCSNEICSDKQGVVSPCIYKEEYACYKTAKCERQPNGTCGWTMTLQLTQCLQDNKQ